MVACQSELLDMLEIAADYADGVNSGLNEFAKTGLIASHLHRTRCTVELWVVLGSEGLEQSELIKLHKLLKFVRGNNASR